MKSSYQLFHRTQDIGKRIQLLHRRETLSIGVIATESDEDLVASLSQIRLDYEKWNLYVLMHREQGAINQLREDFPDFSFIVFSEAASFGAMVNVLADECFTSYFFLSRTDVSCSHFSEQEVVDFFHQWEKPAVVVPLLYNRLHEKLPAISVPFKRGHLLDPLSFIPTMEVERTLYPFLGLGFYDRALFQRVRGFDELIGSEYWQLLDFGLRCNLYGYQILSFPHMQCTFNDRQFIIENRSFVEGMNRVHTKALGVKQVKGKNYLSKAGKYKEPHLAKEMQKKLALYRYDFQLLLRSWPQPKE
ncbi:MAG: hypothetical protein ACOX0W_08455 [Sphaerochaetaceae bacterium]|jgi:GT2 family glycosyltransferase